MSKVLNRFFSCAEKPTIDLANMLTNLDGRGLIPVDMRKAILQHAENRVSTLPVSVASTARALASAANGDLAIDGEDIANAAYGIASMAEQMEGFLSMVEKFNRPSDLDISTGVNSCQSKV